MRKIIFIFLIFGINFFYIYPISKIKDDIKYDSIYFENSVEEIIDKDEFKTELIDNFRKSILENDDLTQEEKEEKMDIIKSIEFKRRQFVFLAIISRPPLTQKERDIKFKLFAKDDENLIEDIFYFEIKYGYGGGGVAYYKYLWVIKSKLPMTREYIDKKLFPIKMIVKYPDDKFQEYKIF